LSKVIKINEGKIQYHLGHMVRSGVEQTLNELLDAEAIKKAELVSKKLKAMKLSRAAELVRDGAEETMRYYRFPREHWRQLRTNNPLERVMREIRRRSRVVGWFADGNSALMLAAARLRHIAGTRWGTKQYMSMKRLQELQVEATAATG
jgi:transposase-like protein